MSSSRTLLPALAITALSGCAIGYHGRIDSRDQTPHSVSAQFLYLGRVLAGVTVASAAVRESVTSEGRSETRYGIPVGYRVLDTSPDGVDPRWELWPFAGGVLDGGAPGFDAGLHVRYERLGYLEIGVERTFGAHGDGQAFVGGGFDLGRMNTCGCMPWD
ncbi:MAG: hypothetical protein JNK64_34750 [Myxococcales bacterium]|nr:hypothetical protein [Myxococcales bacterium]